VSPCRTGAGIVTCIVQEGVAFTPSNANSHLGYLPGDEKSPTDVFLVRKLTGYRWRKERRLPKKKTRDSFLMTALMKLTLPALHMDRSCLEHGALAGRSG
jgi:hypothetical protein